MGYREQKRIAEEKKNRLKRIALCIFIFLIIAGVIFSCFVPPESWKYYFDTPKVGKRKAGELRIHYVDVGQGDCSIIELPDGKIMLIDGGDGTKRTKKRVMRYLNGLKVDTIDYLLVTHTDNDHCGSLEEVFRYKKVLNAYLPPSFDGDDDVEFAETYAAAVKSDCVLRAPSRYINLSGTGETPYVLTFLYPHADETESGYGGNDASSVVWLDYHGVSALFCGDASSTVEAKLMAEDGLGFFDSRGVRLQETEILKVAHHGSDESTCAEFLSYLHLQDAIISCGKDNPYFHPAEAVLDRLSAVGATAHRTDRLGNIVVTVTADGEYSVKSF